MHATTTQTVKMLTKGFVLYCLRSNSALIDYGLTHKGWLKISKLIEYAKSLNFECDEIQVNKLLQSFDEGAIEIDTCTESIRCLQGHALGFFEITYELSCPPEYLFHWTSATKVIDIFAKGLLPMTRNYVYLFAKEIPNQKWKLRAHDPVLIKIKAQEARTNGYFFAQAGRDIWVSNKLPAKYLLIVEQCRA